MKTASVRSNQAPLRTHYQYTPAAALITDHARAAGKDPGDPFHSTVEPMPGSGVSIAVGVHRAVGGLHDAPTPGDILCAALAACQDSTLRMVANILGITLEYLSVEVTAKVDVRGTLLVDPLVPIGFQSMHCKVELRAREGTKAELVTLLQETAERCCVVQQTLRTAPLIETSFKTRMKCTTDKSSKED
jgi:uncharacterized OsmC-like protein